MRSMILSPFILSCILLLLAVSGYSEESSSKGKLRLEFSGGPAFELGSADRSGDFLLKSTVEYEMPLSPRITLGLRLLPFFLYDQENKGEDMVWGGGFGIGGRFYLDANTYRGLFAEVNTHVVGHEGKIQGNSSKINFLSGLGMGYAFESGWHTVLKWEHISNARLKNHNQGTDCVTVGIGFTF